MGNKPETGAWVSVRAAGDGEKCASLENVLEIMSAGRGGGLGGGRGEGDQGIQGLSSSEPGWMAMLLVSLTNPRAGTSSGARLKACVQHGRGDGSAALEKGRAVRRRDSQPWGGG